MEDAIPALLQENYVAQILIFYAKSRRKMNGIWQKDIPSKFARDCRLAESCWLFPGCGSGVWRRRKVPPHQISLFPSLLSCNLT